MPEHLPGPWALFATLASSTGSAALSQILMDTTHPLTVGLGAVLTGLAALIWQRVYRLRWELQRDQDAAERRALGESE